MISRDSGLWCIKSLLIANPCRWPLNHGLYGFLGFLGLKKSVQSV
ncbi:Uncharacterized protein dnm_066900 [Desulfonema magnum]|uniref:Uncharacterized protein n=1 Tax=Desulfonema magnum TaxID=45655 RepID=A0A975GR58_9BACT|nr:Uncharacterized protein dnm_066900 [Desulfonema magnum]